jgi:hypothetical protein
MSINMAPSLSWRSPSARQPAVSSTPRQIEASVTMKPARHGDGRPRFRSFQSRSLGNRIALYIGPLLRQWAMSGPRGCLFVPTRAVRFLRAIAARATFGANR